MSGGIGGGTTEGFDLSVKGQIHGFSTSDSAISVSGNDDYVLVEDSSDSLGVAWKENAHSSVTASSTTTFTNKSIALSGNTLTGTSAELITAISDETGSGSLVFATSPTFVTPVLGTPASGTLTNATGLVATTGLTATGTKDSSTYLTGNDTWTTISSLANSYLESVYDISSTVPKKHFVEFFTTDGTIPERWNSTVSGTGSITIPTGDNNGILLNTGTTASSTASINLNNVNNFAYDNASLIFVGSISSLASNFEAYLGFQTDTTFGSGVGAGIYAVHSKSVFSSWSSDGSFTFADSSVTADTNPHVFQVTLSASNVKTYIDGTLATTIETDLPNAVMQPCFEINTSGTDRNFNMTYCEAWNI